MLNMRQSRIDYIYILVRLWIILFMWLYDKPRNHPCTSSGQRFPNVHNAKLLIMPRRSCPLTAQFLASNADTGLLYHVWLCGDMPLKFHGWPAITTWSKLSDWPRAMQNEMSANALHQTIMAFSALAGYLPGRSTGAPKIPGETSNTSKGN